MKQKRKRCAVVGIGHRARSWISEIVGTYHQNAELLALCDPVTERCRDINREFKTKAAVFSDYDRMLSAVRPDMVIVTSPDYLHAEHIVKACDLGCQVATEKPLCTTGADAQRILEAEKRSGKKVIMGFNYRHIPLSMKVKELLLEGSIGEPVSMDLTWYLDYRGHGLSYFRRWHRLLACSGGLLITKGSHHLDLANWLMNDRPKTVYARCKQQFFGPRHNTYHGTRCSTCNHAKSCAFFTDINLKKIDYAKLSRELGYEVRGVRDYIRDYCPFGQDVDIYDTMGLVVEYERGGILNYTLNAAVPFEGWNLAINGRKGRLEAALPDTKPVQGWQNKFRVLSPDGHLLPPSTGYLIEYPQLYKIFVMPYDVHKAHEVEVPNIYEGHGGGDRNMFNMIFLNKKIKDPLHCFASALDGAFSAGIGAAANQSAITGHPVHFRDILGKWAG